MLSIVFPVIVGGLEQQVEESLEEDEQGKLSVDEVDIVARPDEDPFDTVSDV